MFALALHGGAGARRKRNYHEVRRHLGALAEDGRVLLKDGAPALDVAVAVVAEMEASGLYLAGRGASPNAASEYELDACVMDGVSRRAGAVVCVRDIESPIRLARLVMERTPHVMLCGAGAEAFARAQGAALVADPTSWFTHVGGGDPNCAPAAGTGTVGCVVRDAHGALASATSTAGVFDKMPGRVGDSPLIGAGGWADDKVAVSCTGQGEFFIRTAAAARLAAWVGAGVEVAVAADRIISEVATLGGEGGIIAIDSAGAIAMPFNTEGMKCASLAMDGTIRVAVFDD